MTRDRIDETRLTMPAPGRNIWFYEMEGSEKDSSHGMKIEAVLLEKRSEFQDILVFRNRTFGQVLVLDGIIQLTEFDQSGYHEMIAHVPLLCHPHPRRVLVIGGGDGGTVTQVVKHPEVERVVLCEIDRAVVEVCRENFPALTRALSDPRVSVIYGDGAAYAAEHPGGFDVIIVDGPDPVGPAEVLFTRPFYQTLAETLSPGGIAVTQAESLFYHPGFIAGLLGFISEIFPVAAHYTTKVPTYPSGMIGFNFCSLGPRPTAQDTARAAGLPDLEYYSPAVHQAAFALPPRILNRLPEKVKRLHESLTANG
ncbi:MAG: polyamine aminopropyltransferase [Thermodesulfobacteriota bacterium]